MKTKILTINFLLILSIAFYSCEKEESNMTTNFETSTKNKDVTNKSTTFGDNNNETIIIESAITTRDHFNNISQVPETSEWFQYFESVTDLGNLMVNGEVETENEVEASSLLSDYFDAYYEATELTVTDVNNFRNLWLNTVSINSSINIEEKNYISNIIYVTVGVKRIFIEDIIVTSDYPPSADRAHPWEIRFNLCMRKKVPSGFFKRLLWVLDGGIFIDVADCIIEASTESKPIKL